jgi:hypothetical protein
MPSTVSPELNFIHRKLPNGYPSFKDAEKVCVKVNRVLSALVLKTGVWMRAKPDTLHPANTSKANYSATYSIEIVPVNYFEIYWFEKSGWEWPTVKTSIDALFVTLKKRFGLVPSVVTQKNGVKTYWSGGGSHLHVGADLYDKSVHFYQDIERFHRNIAVQYANRPFIRWLFADWMSKDAHHLVWKPGKRGAKPKYGDTWEDDVFYRLVHQAFSIEPRFMQSSKNSYLTFEFRFFRMIENAKELGLIVRFVQAWMKSVKADVLQTHTEKFTMNRRKWNALMKPDKAWKEISAFLTEIGLDPKDYHLFFKRNYLMRLTHGSMD